MSKRSGPSEDSWDRRTPFGSERIEYETDPQTFNLNPREVLAIRNLLPGSVVDCDSGYNRPLDLTSRSKPLSVDRCDSDRKPIDAKCKRSPTFHTSTEKRNEGGSTAANFTPTSTKAVSVEGHSFIRKNLHKPACCHHCGELIWGLLSTGFQCESK